MRAKWSISNLIGKPTGKRGCGGSVRVNLWVNGLILEINGLTRGSMGCPLAFFTDIYRTQNS